jgi:hypothetical protein
VWEKIFAISDKRLITRIYRELERLNSPITNEPTKKWATDFFQWKKSKWPEKTRKNAHHPLT